MSPLTSQEQQRHGEGALYLSSAHGDLESVKALLKADVNANARGGEYGTALQSASLGGQIEIVKLLLETGADINAKGGPFDNALQTASYGGHLEIVKLLLDRGADVSAQGGFFGNALQAASRKGHIEIVQSLLESNADVSVQGGAYCTALAAAYLGEHTEIVGLLKKNGAESNFRWTDRLGGTFLHLTAREGCCSGIENGLAWDLDMNALDNHRWSPLHWAAYFGRNETIQLLLRKGADSGIRDWRDLTPYQVALRSGQSRTTLALFPEFDDNSASVEHNANSESGLCNSCGHGLNNLQFHCRTCPTPPGYDLCERCAQDRSAIHPNHDFGEGFRYVLIK